MQKSPIVLGARAIQAGKSWFAHGLYTSAADRCVSGAHRIGKRIVFRGGFIQASVHHQAGLLSQILRIEVPGDTLAIGLHRAGGPPDEAFLMQVVQIKKCLAIAGAHSFAQNSLSGCSSLINATTWEEMRKKESWRLPGVDECCSAFPRTVWYRGTCLTCPGKL
jgi:hypothetical protein